VGRLEGNGNTRRRLGGLPWPWGEGSGGGRRAWSEGVVGAAALAGEVAEDAVHAPGIGDYPNLSDLRTNYPSSTLPIRYGTPGEEDRMAEVTDRLYDLQYYPFTVLELSQTIEEEAAAEVFVQINSKAIPLSQADSVLTLVSVF